MTQQERVREALEGGPLSVKELSERLGVPRELLSATLIVLRRKGITRPLGPAAQRVKHCLVSDAEPPSVRDPKCGPRKYKVRARVEPVERPAVTCALADSWGWWR